MLSGVEAFTSGKANILINFLKFKYFHFFIPLKNKNFKEKTFVPFDFVESLICGKTIKFPPKSDNDQNEKLLSK